MKYHTDDVRITGMEEVLPPEALIETLPLSDAASQLVFTERRELSDIIQLPTCPADRTHSYMLYGIVTKRDIKHKLVHFLENLNIETRDLLPLINQPVYQKMFGNLDAEYPVAHWLNNNGFYIGCHSFLSDDEVSFVIEAFREFRRTQI